jgi:hypothetical protein
MAVELRVTLRGTVPGMHEGELSMASLGESLQALFVAYQGTASAILAQAAGDPSYGGHRLRKKAYSTDLLLVRQEKACLRLTFRADEALPPDGQMGMIPDLAQRAITQLLSDLREESQGREVSRFARNYLRSLPQEVESQTYAGYVGDQLIDSVDIGAVEFAPPPRNMPRTERLLCQITGVRFEEGKELVTATDVATGHALRFDATPELVESALSLRASPALAMALHTAEGRRLLWLRPPEWTPPSPEDRAREIFTRWAGLLERLA